MKAKYTDQEFIQIVSESKTIREILIKLKITPYGGNYRHIYRKMERLGIHNSFKQKNNLDKKRLKDFSDEEIIVVVKDSTSVQMVFNKLDIRYGGSSYKAFYRKMNELDVDTSHFTGQLWNKGKTLPSKVSLETYFNNTQYITSHRLKLRLLKDGIFTHICSNCNLSEWCGNKIPLELDHIDGNHLNNNLSNIRLLCPNCHAQTPTYAGKNKGKYGPSRT